MITHQHFAPGVLNIVYGEYVLRMIWESSSLGERDVATILLWNESELIREDYLPWYDKKRFGHALYVAQHPEEAFQMYVDQAEERFEFLFWQPDRSLLRA